TSIVDAQEVINRVRLAVDEMTRCTRDQALRGERQGVGHGLPWSNAGVMRRALVVVAQDAPLLEIGREERPRRGPIALERGLLGGVTTRALGVGPMHVLAWRFLGRADGEERREENRHEHAPSPPGPDPPTPPARLHERAASIIDPIATHGQTSLS